MIEIFWANLKDQTSWMTEVSTEPLKCAGWGRRALRQIATENLIGWHHIVH